MNVNTMPLFFVGAVCCSAILLAPSHCAGQPPVRSHDFGDIRDTIDCVLKPLGGVGFQYGAVWIGMMTVEHDKTRDENYVRHIDASTKLHVQSADGADNEVTVGVKFGGAYQGDCGPLFSTIYRVATVTQFPDHVVLERVAKFPEGVDWSIAKGDLAVMLGNDATFFPRRMDDGWGTVKLTDIVRDAQGKLSAKCGLTIEVEVTGSHGQETKKDVTLSEADDVFVGLGCTCRVVKIIPPDKGHKAVGWVVLRPRLDKKVVFEAPKPEPPPPPEIVKSFEFTVESDVKLWGAINVTLRGGISAGEVFPLGDRFLRVTGFDKHHPWVAELARDSSGENATKFKSRDGIYALPLGARVEAFVGRAMLSGGDFKVDQISVDKGTNKPVAKLVIQPDAMDRSSKQEVTTKQLAAGDVLSFYNGLELKIVAVNAGDEQRRIRGWIEVEPRLSTKHGPVPRQTGGAILN